MHAAGTASGRGCRSSAFSRLSSLVSVMSSLVLPASLAHTSNLPFSSWCEVFGDRAVCRCRDDRLHRPTGRRPHPQRRQLPAPRTRHRQPPSIRATTDETEMRPTLPKTVHFFERNCSAFRSHRHHIPSTRQSACRMHAALVCTASGGSILRPLSLATAFADAG